MSHPSKRKGTAYERELVDQINEHRALAAKRAWGSNGEALGKSAEVDVLVTRFEPEQLGFVDWELTIQAKRRKKIAQYMKPPEGVDCAMIREDRGDTLVVIRLDTFLDLIQ